MPEKLNENEKRRYVHYTLHPDEIMKIVYMAAGSNVSQSCIVSACVNLAYSLGGFDNNGLTIKSK